MKIYYDNIIFSLQKTGGISLYWSKLISRILKKESEVLLFESSNDSLYRREGQGERLIESPAPIKILRYFPFLKKCSPKSIFHSSYYRFSLSKKTINIVTVYDFTYEYYRSGLSKWVHHFQKMISIYKADGVICISENTKKDLFKFFNFSKRKKIKVIYIGVNEGFYPISCEYDFEYRDPFLLYVGSRDRYKNFNYVIDALKLLPNYRLVIVGKKLSRKELLSINENTQKRIKVMSDVDQISLNKLYNQAHCLLYLSDYEGFGIPVAEAMKSGCPVVTFGGSSLPEVSGSEKTTAKYGDVKDVCRLIKKLENKIFREGAVSHGIEYVKRFSWDRCSEETYQFYQEIYHDLWK